MSYEINLIVVHPFLEWGGLAIFALAIAALIVTTFGIATLVSGMRAGIGTVRGLPRRLRRIGPVPETSPSVETAEETEEGPAVQRAEEVPAKAVEEALAKPAPEMTVVLTTTTKPKMIRPRKRKLAAAKKERATRKRRTRRKVASQP